MKKFTRQQVSLAGRKLGVDFKATPFMEWYYGVHVELEHGTMLGKKANLTNNSLMKTAKIAYAHILEHPRYYKYLKKMEVKLEKMKK